MNILTQKHIDRFWGKVDKEKSTIFYNGTRCWEWAAGHTVAGYGIMSIDRVVYYAHRISYEINYEQFPGKMFVLHHCDNPPCVNPGHLFLGTAKDNAVDKVSKGRQSRLFGEKSGKHKLTDKQVDEIKQRYKWFGVGGNSSACLAKEFDVSQGHILAVINGTRRK